jgi:single-stranded-DNA-specific exonuclease
MECAAARLADAVEARQSVAIFGDYDVDGATSSALLQGVLAALGCPTRIYIPDRIFEGYGPNPEAIDNLIDGGADLIVCVDCGSTSFAPLERARSRGVDLWLWITTGRGGAAAGARGGQPEPTGRPFGQGHLAAVGVTFLAAVALLRELRRRGHPGPFPDLLTFLDFVALGTVCDMVPLVGLNRAFVAKGLVALRHTERPGLKALIAASRLKSAPDCGHLGFLLGPRINAGGRIGEATLGARLLATEDHAEAEQIAATLDRLNEERQAIEVAAVSEAAAEAEAEIGAGPGPSVLLVSRDHWHPGIVGLVAARLKERFCRPSFAIAWNGAVGAGSGRSIPGVDIGAAVRAAVESACWSKAADTRWRRGSPLSGKAWSSAGPTRNPARACAPRFRRTSRAGDRQRPVKRRRHGGPRRDIDRAGPFGNGNPAPVFAFPAHRIQFADLVGNGHVRITLGTGAEGLKAIAFRRRKPSWAGAAEGSGKRCTSPARCAWTLGRIATAAIANPGRRRSRRPHLAAQRRAASFPICNVRDSIISLSDIVGAGGLRRNTRPCRCPGCRCGARFVHDGRSFCSNAPR